MRPVEFHKPDGSPIVIDLDCIRFIERQDYTPKDKPTIQGSLIHGRLKGEYDCIFVCEPMQVVQQIILSVGVNAPAGNG